MPFPPVIINTDRPFDKPVIRLQQGATRTVVLQIRDMYGNMYDFDGNEYVYFESFVEPSDTEAYLPTVGTVDATANTVSFTFSSSAISIGGWFYGQITISAVTVESGSGSEDDSTTYEPMHRMETFLEVEPQYGNRNRYYPLMIEAVRNKLKDRSPDDNSFLDDLEFSDSEIANAIFDAVEYWNTTTPNVNVYSPTTFPFTEIWMYGTLYELYRTAYMNLTRNRLSTNAGGMTYDDKQRADAYAKLSEMYEQEFKKGVAAKKREINCNAWIGVTGRF
jgi:hypothetical protein